MAMRSHYRGNTVVFLMRPLEAATSRPQ